MRNIKYPQLLEKISHNVKVIWFGVGVDEVSDAWEELATRIIRVPKPVDVEQMLDMKGMDDVRDDF